MKYFVFLLSALILMSCEKDYSCVCTLKFKGKDTLIDHIKTTKLGSKGYRKTCSDKENTTLMNCRLQ